MRNPARFLTEAGKLPIEPFEWGTLQWLYNSKLDPQAEQTLGICHLFPEQENPRHYHPNCEEILHVIQGIGQHSFEDETIELSVGMTLRIPVGVTHNFKNIGNEPLVCMITFNSGHRQTVFVNE